MSNVTQQLIDRDIRARQEVRRATVLTEVRLVEYNPGGNTLERNPVWVVDVDIGGTRPVRNVIVKSPTGRGGREFASFGKAIEIQRNAGGRWIVIGSSDRIRNTTSVQTLSETTNLSAAASNEGFTFVRRPYDFYLLNGSYGSAGYGDTFTADAAGNEVF